jgi:glycosyltransferase involved in cell wall biosynthesis
MKNYAGIERILTCKMNYIASHTSYDVYLTNYEQQGQPLPFPLDARIIYKPIDAVMPQRNEMTMFQWLKAYRYSRNSFKQQFNLLINHINPDIVISTVYSFQVLDLIIKSCHQKGIKTIMESHTKGETVTLSQKYRYNRYLFRLFSLWDYHILSSLNQCNCIVTLTQQDVPFWHKYAKRIEVVPNMLTITPKRVTDYRVKRVISAGRYMSEKGFDMLLEAWHLLPNEYSNWHLYIFGNGDRTAYLKIVEKYHMEESVHLMPATNDVAEEFSKSSIYVMSSRYEGFGLVLAEAMSCGLPCVSFDCPYGPREIINDGEDGLLARYKDIKDFANTISKLMSDSCLRYNLCKQALKNIMRYEPQAIMNRWINLFDTL